MTATLQRYDIGHASHVALIDPDTAFWALVTKKHAAARLANGALLDKYAKKSRDTTDEIDRSRLGRAPSCVYLNPTERCNLDCTYCGTPSGMPFGGRAMEEPEIFSALERLDTFFSGHLLDGRLPQVIFHGAEPLLNRTAVFSAIEKFGDRFRFGVQVNATLLDDAAVAFLTARGVGIGLSLELPVAEIAGSYQTVLDAIARLRGYHDFSVICSVTRENVGHLVDAVDLLHASEVPACALNVVRNALPAARTVRATDEAVARHYLAALDRSQQLLAKTGRKLVVVNFANILLAILAPTAHRRMSDISPCSAGRSFFAMAASGDLFPCGEFMGRWTFKGGNLFRDSLSSVLASPQFRQVTERKVEDIESCRQCSIRHFCGSPCPAEIGGYCDLYKEETKYAFRLIADGKEDDFLWDDWAVETVSTFDGLRT